MNSQHSKSRPEQLPMLKAPSLSLSHPNVFKQSLNNKKIQNKTKLTLGHMKKSQPNAPKNDDGDYADDFDAMGDNDYENTPQGRQPNQKKGPQLPSAPLVKNKRQVKSVIAIRNVQSYSTYDSAGKYAAEVEKRLGGMAATGMTNEAINRANEQIREFIKKYNETLTDIINKNLYELSAANKKKKATSSEESLRVLEEQIKSNQKVQLVDSIQLRRLEEMKARLEGGDVDQQADIEEQIADLQTTIKQAKKQIVQMKQAVSNEAKKLLPADITATKSDVQADNITLLKEKIAKLKKEHDRNQERIAAQEDQEYDLTQKVSGLGDKQKEVDTIRQSSRESETKSKKYLEVKKKYESLKSHNSKVESLWNAKSSMVAHENEAIRQKTKNLDLEIKNIEDSISQAYEKTLKVLSTFKPKNQASQRNLQKILEEMKGSGSDEYLKKQSMTNMKMVMGKRHSVDSPNEEPASKHYYSIATEHLESKPKQGSQEEPGQRVWREDDKAKLQTLVHTQQLKPNSVTRSSVQETKLEKSQSQLEVNKEAIKEEEKVELKPKKFNFNRNKAASEQVEAPQLPPKQNNPKNDSKVEGSTNGVHSKQIRIKAELPFNTRQNEIGVKKIQQKVDELKNNSEESPIIQPKRLNMNLRNKKAKEQSESYLPTINAHDNRQQKPAAVTRNKTNLSAVDNEFMD